MQVYTTTSDNIPLTSSSSSTIAIPNQIISNYFTNELSMMNMNMSSTPNLIPFIFQPYSWNYLPFYDSTTTTTTATSSPFIYSSPSQTIMEQTQNYLQFQTESTTSTTMTKVENNNLNELNNIPIDLSCGSINSLSKSSSTIINNKVDEIIECNPMMIHDDSSITSQLSSRSPSRLERSSCLDSSNRLQRCLPGGCNSDCADEIINCNNNNNNNKNNDYSESITTTNNNNNHRKIKSDNCLQCEWRVNNHLIITDDNLLNDSTKKLRSYFHGLTREEVLFLKKRRRTLKNRLYAQVFRKKKENKQQELNNYSEKLKEKIQELEEKLMTFEDKQVHSF